jgi:hypothetical protein
MIFRQVLRTETGCAYYLIGSGVKSAAVIDPTMPSPQPNRSNPRP